MKSFPINIHCEICLLEKMDNGTLSVVMNVIMDSCLRYQQMENSLHVYKSLFKRKRTDDKDGEGDFDQSLQYRRARMLAESLVGQDIRCIWTWAVDGSY